MTCSGTADRRRTVIDGAPAVETETARSGRRVVFIPAIVCRDMLVPLFMYDGCALRRDTVLMAVYPPPVVVVVLRPVSADDMVVDVIAVA